EAALKYVIYGSVAAGLMLYGFSLFYGMTGSLQLGAISKYLAAGAYNPYAVALATFLAFAGFGYKMAAVPMQFWAPDVYQGAPTSVTAWLSVASKRSEEHTSELQSPDQLVSRLLLEKKHSAYGLGETTSSEQTSAIVDSY